MQATALIAEDEPLLAADLQATLTRLWPALRVVATVGDGESAVSQSLALRPDVLFLDIRMPEMSGLEVAQALAEDWPDDGRAFPAIVFVTAYDQYAVPAFEHAAVDYVLKPVQPERLALTCARLQASLRPRTHGSDLVAVIAQLRGLLAAGVQGPPAAASGRLRLIQASAGNTVTMVPIDEVLYFEAADKYVRVVTAAREHLIRLSLRELQPQLDPEFFWQIHRGRIVRCAAILSAQRDETGRVTLTLRGRAETLLVSRFYTHLFRGM